MAEVCFRPFGWFAHLGMVRSVNLSRTALRGLPDSLRLLVNVEAMDLSRNRLVHLPESFGSLAGLVNRALGSNDLAGLPESIGSLRVLEHLTLSHNRLCGLPGSIANLRNLNLLDVSYNALRTLPDSMVHLSVLANVYLDDNMLCGLAVDVEVRADTRQPQSRDYAVRMEDEEGLQLWCRCGRGCNSGSQWTWAPTPYWKSTQNCTQAGSPVPRGLPPDAADQPAVAGLQVHWHDHQAQ